MEKPERKKKKKSRRRKRHECSSSPSSRSLLQNADADTLFAVMLAALSKYELHGSTSDELTVIQTCLHQILVYLLPNSRTPFHQTLPVPILSLIPSFINSKSGEIVCTSLEIVGAASLFSFEMNEQIALDEEILKGLIAAMLSSKRSTLMAACNAVLDLSTTSFGCQQLLELSPVNTLIWGVRRERLEEIANGIFFGCNASYIHKRSFQFIQVPRSSEASISLFTEESWEICPRIGFVEDEFPLLLLHATIFLINACTIEQLEKITTELSKKLLSYLKRLWVEVHKQTLLCNFMIFSQEGHFRPSNITKNSLAESIFRLSMKSVVTTPADFREIKRNIFDLGDMNFDYFLLNHWEASPLHIRRPSTAFTEEDGIFNSLLHLFRSKEAVPSFTASLLKNLVSALPISSDELNVISFLNEVRTHLGCPLIYQQDIRVLKTQKPKEEMHFFQEQSKSCDLKGPYFMYADDILRCEEAYKEGYTIALRGMEFRFEGIAAIAEGIASLFGQPSVGVNMYLTPPNSQGLACHTDDHCVLVCQLSGLKRWRIFTKVGPRLPRLYEPTDNSHDLEGESSKMVGCEQFLMREGDVLYIPRGFPHEACTFSDGDGGNGNGGFSLHLTLAIEVEPPFEWEGFAHVALHHWVQENMSRYISGNVLSSDLHVVCVGLMHLSVKVIGDTDVAFRKACLVGTIQLLSETKDWFDMSQKTTFSCLVSRISTESRFNDLITYLEAAVLKKEDPFQKIRWLHHLNKKEEETMEGHYLNISAIGTENLYQLLMQHEDKAETAFLEVKSRFCNEVVYEDVRGCYKVLLEKYRKARKQYRSGMLSLHCNQS